MLHNTTLLFNLATKSSEKDEAMRHIESSIQKNCIMWFRLQYRHLGKAIFAVPNGGFRNAREAAIMKAEGVTPGVADVILLVARHGFNSLCIEFKTQRGRQSELQKEWQKQAEENGNKYVICRSFMEFKEIVDEYLSEP